jgi:hypothetical protein
VNWEKVGRAIHLLVWMSSNRIAIILYQDYANSKEISLTCNKHVGFKALCTKQVGFKALVIIKSFSSLLIGCVRHPTPCTDKGSSSITDNMITFNGISVYRESNTFISLDVQ